MLRQLRIENLVLARDVLLEFSEGLNLITGETGAGKSLISGALALACGARGEASLVRQGTKRALVEAIFDLGSREDVIERLTRGGYEAPGGELLIRRELGSDGRSRAFVGGSSATISVLREITGDLVELHGQHEPQTLLQPEYQRMLLDQAGGHGALVSDVRRAAAALREISARLRDLGERSKARASRLEILGYRLAEFDQVRPLPSEDDELRQERERLRHAEEIGGAIQGAVELLYEGEDAALDKIHGAARRMRAQAAHGEGFAELADRLDDLRAQVGELAGDLRSEGEGLASDPDRLAEIEDRLHDLERLRRRFDGVPLADVIASADVMRREIDDLTARDGVEQELNAELERQWKGYQKAANRLYLARLGAGEELARRVEGLLSELAMEKAHLEVSVSRPEIQDLGPKDAAPEGLERVEVMLQANPGEPARPLRKVASGGEISRVMLALDIALEGKLPRRTLLFDEVDQGLGGEAADRLGDFLLRVAANHQVISITHLPQVAARAHKHIYVTKKVRSGRTVAVVRVLEEKDDRIEELARMIGGSMVTETARRHAEAMVEWSGSEGAG